MQFFSSRIKFLLVSLTPLALMNQACLAKPGDLISHTVTHSTVSTYRVAGWQNQLTNVTPNLGNYYWEPMTKRIINTTRTTSKGATAAPPITAANSGRYVKPIHANSPTVNHSLPPLVGRAGSLPPQSASTSTSLSYNTHPVMTYQDTSIAWSNKHVSEQSASATKGTRETVYGVLKTPISSMRSKVQSL